MSKILDAVDAINDARKLVKAIGMASFSLRLDQRRPLYAVAEAADEKLEKARVMLLQLVTMFEGDGDEIETSMDDDDGQ